MKMSLNNIKIRLVLPVFFGCLGSLFICTMFIPGQPDVIYIEEITVTAEAPVQIEREYIEIAQAVQFFTGDGAENGDIIQEAFRQPESRELVIEFFAGICPTLEIAEAILFNADLFDIPPALALALAWEESRLNPLAVNNANRDGSIDRGLFQLNNRSFPHLDLQSFFELESNTRYGMNYLRYCLDTGGSEIAALAMYNAGEGRVNSSGTPKSTLNYINRILDNRTKIENRFREWNEFFHEPEFEPDEGIFEETDETIPERDAAGSRRLMPLMPLAGVK